MLCMKAALAEYFFTSCSCLVTATGNCKKIADQMNSKSLEYSLENPLLLYLSLCAKDALQADIHKPPALELHSISIAIVANLWLLAGSMFSILCSLLGISDSFLKEGLNSSRFDGIQDHNQEDIQP